MDAPTVKLLFDPKPSGIRIVKSRDTLRPVSSETRKKLLDNVDYLEAQAGRLVKMAKEMRAEIQSLTVE